VKVYLPTAFVDCFHVSCVDRFLKETAAPDMTMPLREDTRPSMSAVVTWLNPVLERPAKTDTTIAIRPVFFIRYSSLVPVCKFYVRKSFGELLSFRVNCYTRVA
jgi:hypothetical protein